MLKCLGKDVAWFAAVLFALFIGAGTRDRYQATSIGSKAFVLDKTTGEAWISTKVSGIHNRSELEMVPVHYGAYQHAGVTQVYLPEDTRNCQNAEWGTVIDRKLSSFFNPGVDYVGQYEVIPSE